MWTGQRGIGMRRGCVRALSRMASSTGVVDMVDMKRESLRVDVMRRSIWVHEVEISSLEEDTAGDRDEKT